MAVSVVEPQRVLRLDSLTGLRWWAAFGVFAYHMHNLAPLPIDSLLRYGNFGVMFFFVLSGFVLTWSANPKVSARTFWWRRLARIYPSHFVALLLAIPVFYSFSPLADQPWVKPISIGVLVLSVFLLQGWSRDPVILFSGNPAAWTLTCEVFFYALHPALNRMLRVLRMRSAVLVALAIVVGAFGYRVCVLLWPASFLPDLPLPISRVSEFALGMAVAHLIRLGWRPRLSPLVVYPIGAAFLVWLVKGTGVFAGGAIGALLRSTANEWLLVLCTLLIVSIAARDIRGGSSLLRNRVLVMLGEWSYTFYLVHATILYAVLAAVGVQPVGWSNLVWYAGMLVLALAGAAALHYLVEKPCERSMRAYWDRRLKRREASSQSPKVNAPI